MHDIFKSHLMSVGRATALIQLNERKNGKFPTTTTYEMNLNK
jgi:hypothetical protein